MILRYRCIKVKAVENHCSKVVARFVSRSCSAAIFELHLPDPSARPAKKFQVIAQQCGAVFWEKIQGAVEM